MANEPVKIDDLKEEFNQLRKEMGDVLSAVKNMGQNAARTARSRAGERLDEAGNRLNQAYDSAYEVGERAAKTTRGEIESHPVASISIALVVGVIVGKLISLK